MEFFGGQDRLSGFHEIRMDDGPLDIDSDQPSAFTDEDRAGLERVVSWFGRTQ